MEESANVNIEVKIGALRKNLLDLTMRNKLLNFKPQAKSIRVVDEIPTEIYQLMVLEDKKLRFMPRQANESYNKTIDKNLEEKNNIDQNAIDENNVDIESTDETPVKLDAEKIDTRRIKT